jgi:hypothetical protein
MRILGASSSVGTPDATGALTAPSIVSVHATDPLPAVFLR